MSLQGASSYLDVASPPAVDPMGCSTKQRLRGARAGIPENIRQCRWAGRAEVKAETDKGCMCCLGSWVVVRLQGKN